MQKLSVEEQRAIMDQAATIKSRLQSCTTKEEVEAVATDVRPLITEWSGGRGPKDLERHLEGIHGQKDTAARDLKGLMALQIMFLKSHMIQHQVKSRQGA